MNKKKPEKLGIVGLLLCDHLLTHENDNRLHSYAVQGRSVNAPPTILQVEIFQQGRRDKMDNGVVIRTRAPSVHATALMPCTTMTFCYHCYCYDHHFIIRTCKNKNCWIHSMTIFSIKFTRTKTPNICTLQKWTSTVWVVISHRHRFLTFYYLFFFSFIEKQKQIDRLKQIKSPIPTTSEPHALR